MSSPTSRPGCKRAAAHQAIRQLWFFTALLLDAYAVVGQSLVAYFIARENKSLARKAAAQTILWSVGSGFLVGILLLVIKEPAIALLTPKDAIDPNRAQALEPLIGNVFE